MAVLIIKSGIPSSQTSYDWQVGSYDGGTAAPGGGYKIVVKTMDRTSRDASDGPFTIVASSPPPQQPPRLTSKVDPNVKTKIEVV